MPTYDFACPEGHEFEKFYRSISAAPTEVACPVCGKVAVRQMSAGAGLVFKGSGFYITDYGKDGKKDQRSAASRSTASTSKATESASASASSSDTKGSDSTAASSGTTPAPAAPAAAKKSTE